MSTAKTVLWNDGESLDFQDLNNAQRFLQSQVNDFLIRQRMRVQGGTIIGTTTGVCYALGAGGNVNNTATALRSTNRAGVIAQLPSTSPVTGLDPRALLYYLADDELLTNHDAAHATLDRWDIVCVKLDQVEDGSESRDFKDATTGVLSSTSQNKTRSVVLTKQVVKGANAAAGSAVEPAIPAGFAKWAALFVPATFAATFDVEVHLRDYRVPLGALHRGVVHAPQYANESFDSLAAAGLLYLANAASQRLRSMIPICSPDGRLLNLSLRARLSAGAAVDLVRVQITVASTVEHVIHSFGDTSNVDEEMLLVANGAIVGGSTKGPLWANGWWCPEAGIDNPDTFLAVRVTSAANNDTVAWTKYEVGLS